MPSATPRNSENDASVTMSGGRFSPATSTALSAPPAQPTISASAAAIGIASSQSRYAAPSTTADRPIIEPTDRSIPPVTMTGVSATASSPSSTLKRITSKKFATDKKFGAMNEKTTTSATSA